MKAAFLLYGTLDDLSGGFLYDRNVVRYLERKGDRVEVVSLKQPGYGRALLRNLSGAVARRLAGGTFDVILEDELAHPSLCATNRRLKAFCTCPVVSIVHHLRCSEKWPRWQMRIYRRIEKVYLDSVDAFIFNSTTTRESVRLLLGRTVANVVAFPSAAHVDSPMSESEIRNRAYRKGRLEVLFIGNIIRRKQLHVLVEALGHVTGDCRLTVIGNPDIDADYVAAIDAMIGRMGLASRIVFRGCVTDAELASSLRESHLLVMPSAYEGFGIAYLEAMAFGLPAIGTLSGGATEIISDGSNGFLVPAGDVLTLAGRIRLLAGNRKKLAEMGCNALATYRSRPTWDDCGSAIYAFLHSLYRADKHNRFSPFSQ
jgi:glycosyltransferase involved in cell wall biosynthesis